MNFMLLDLPQLYAYKCTQVTSVKRNLPRKINYLRVIQSLCSYSMNYS